MGNPFGRSTIVPLTNKSGGSVAAGDFVYIDGSNDEAFTTGTTSAYTKGIGIAQATIASNAVGLVLVDGYASLVNVNASVTRLNFLKSHTVVKQGTDAGSSRVAGTCGIFLKSGTTPSAIIWQPDLGAGSGLSDPMTTRGDIIVRNSSNATARLAVGATANMVLKSDATDVSWATLPGTLLGVVLNTAGGNKTTTSATQADVDSTNAAITFTAPASGNVLVRVTLTANLGAVNVNAFLGLRESTTNLVNGTTGTYLMQGETGVSGLEPLVSWVAYITGVSAGSHTYKVAFAVNGGATLTLRASAANPMTIEVWAA